jgi:surface protein
LVIYDISFLRNIIIIIIIIIIVFLSSFPRLSIHTKINYRLRKIIKLPRTSNVTTFYQAFYLCYNLTEVPWFDSSKATNFQRIFSNTKLRNLPPINTSSATDMFQAFESNQNLKTIPWIDTSKVTQMGSMFNSCTSLETIPFINTSSCTNMTAMFYNCCSLRELPLLNTANVTSMDRMCFNTTFLKEVPDFNTSKVTNMYQMFAQTFPQGGGLEKPPIFDTSNVTNMQEMFYFNTKLNEGASFDTSKVTNMSGMYMFCYSLKSIPQYNTSSVTNFSNMLRVTLVNSVPQLDISSGLNFTAMFATNYLLNGFSGFTFHGGTGTWNTTAFNSMFSGCRNLRFIGPIAISGMCSASAYASVYSSMFNECYNLETLGLTGMQHSFSIAEAKLGPTALNNLYESLAVVGASGSGTKTITVTSNWGAANDNPAIAIAKGWTVTG